MLLPDEVTPRVFGEQVAAHLTAGSAVCFASGYALAYDLVKPPDDVDVLLLAPRMLGEEVRARYLDGTGFLSYIGVEQDATGRAEQRPPSRWPAGSRSPRRALGRRAAPVPVIPRKRSGRRAVRR